MDIPCENCLILAMCKAIMGEKGSRYGDVSFLFRKCSLADDYLCQDATIDENYPTSLRKIRMRELMKYLGYYNELNRRDPM